MAASGAVQFALQKLDSILVQEQQLLRGFNTRIKDIKDELESLKIFLRGADAGDDKDDIKAWMRQLRDIAYDMEDLLEEYMFHFGQPRRHRFLGFLTRTIQSLRHSFTRRKMSIAIQDIKTQLRNISERRSPYKFKSGFNASQKRVHDRHLAALFMEEAELVGIRKPKEEIVGRLVKGGGLSSLAVVSVVGMGGLGKTTLVRKVYDDEQIKGWFNSHAWITVTPSFTVEELLRSIIIQFYEERHEKLPVRIQTMECIQLVDTLRRFLQDKRYIAVLDDMWHINAWECLKYALPNSDCGSRIIVTTRNRDIGLSCIESCGSLYELQPLPQPEAWFLFCKKAIRSVSDGVCPPELQDVAEDIVKFCGGLPLAIVTIAGLLSKRAHVLEWRKLHDNLHAELANNPKLEIIKQILLLSYNDLPHFLKSCILYFSIFPKEHAVTRIALIRVWIAEGFIESKRGETMERIAGDYLNDLIDRSMVQVAERFDCGRVRSCRLHDLIHEVIVLKAEEENFSTLMITRDTKHHGKIRRPSTHAAGEHLLQSDLSHLRALFMFGENVLSMSSVVNRLSRLRLLRILDLSGAPIESFPLNFGMLPHLRYLSFRDTRISKLSKSLGQLKNLETLDLKGTYVTELPKTILNLQNLRHLLAYHYYWSHRPPYYLTDGVKLPHGIGKFRELQKLTYLEINQDSSIVRELGNLTQLKRLGLVKFRRVDGESLCKSIEKMEKLQSLSVTSVGIGTDEYLNLQSLTSPPPLLQRLYLKGPLQTLPNWISSLKHLVRMRLRCSRLQEDSFGVLEELPSLVELTLIHAYDGANLRCREGGFQKLKILDLERLNNLNHVVVDGSMPNLQEMYIRSCVQLQEVPRGIQQLVLLKEIHLFDMPEEFVQRLEGEDYPQVSHVPIRRSYNSKEGVFREGDLLTYREIVHSG